MKTHHARAEAPGRAQPGRNRARHSVPFRLLAAAASLACALPGVASAQSDGGAASAAAPASAPGGAADSGSTEQLQTVVVTAQKRTQTIKDVPFSVSVVGGAALEDHQVQNIEDISRTLPGVSFGAGGNTGMSVVTMRGVSSQGGGATVGIFLDDISVVTQNSFNQSYSGATQPKMFDLNRVEVLRGPQGTLYGASSMGGAIKYVTNQPEMSNFTTSAVVDASKTQHGGNNYELTGILNLPLVPGTAALRVGLNYTELSGYIDRYSYIGPTQAAVLAGGDDSKAGALLGRGVNNEKTLATHVVGELRLGGGLVLTPALFAQQIKAGDTSVYYDKLGRYNTDKLVPEVSKDVMLISSLSLKKDFGASDLNATFSHFGRTNNHITDGTYFSSTFIEYLADNAPDTGPCQCGVPFWSLPGPSVTEQKTNTNALEVRLASKSSKTSGNPYTWLLGAFASDRKIHVNDNEYVLGIRKTFIELYGILPENSSFADPFPNDSVGFGYTDDNLRQFAGFGEVSYDLAPNLKATGGLRISRDHTAFLVDQGGYFSQGVPPHVVASNDYTATTPKLALSYELSHDATAFVNATKGNRVGGYIYPINTAFGLCASQAAGVSNAKLNYNPDSLWSYELGAKTTWLDNHLSVNGSIYYIDWKNVQQTFALECGAQITANFGNARSVGGELEVLAKPMKGLTLGFSAGATDAKLTAVAASVGTVASVGQRLLNTPVWTSSMSVDYSWQAFDQYRAFVRGDYAYTGKSYGSYDKTSTMYERPGYGVINASVGADYKSMSFSLYVKNLANNQRPIQQVQIELVNSSYVLRPRTVGVRANMDF